MPELENLDDATDIITAWSGSNCQVLSHAILGSRWANRAIAFLLFCLQDKRASSKCQGIMCRILTNPVHQNPTRNATNEAILLDITR